MKKLLFILFIIASMTAQAKTPFITGSGLDAQGTTTSPVPVARIYHFATSPYILLGYTDTLGTIQDTVASKAFVRTMTSNQRCEFSVDIASDSIANLTTALYIPYYCQIDTIYYWVVNYYDAGGCTVINLTFTINGVTTVITPLTITSIGYVAATPYILYAGSILAINHDWAGNICSLETVAGGGVYDYKLFHGIVKIQFIGHRL